jgi:hypothetical protein
MNTRMQIPAKLMAAPAHPLTPAPFGTLQRKCVCGGSPGSAGQCAECKNKSAMLQRRSTGDAAPRVPPIVHEVLRSSGQPLDKATRAFFEPRFGHDFSKVRVHTDAKASESAQAVHAVAYTVGNDVVFGAAQYAPGTSKGMELLAHELTHTKQQGNSSSSSVRHMSSPNDPYEQQANRIARTVMQHHPKYGIPSGDSKESNTPPELESAPLQRQTDSAPDDSVGQDAVGEEKGIEVGDQLVVFPRWQIGLLPVDPSSAEVSRPSLLGSPILQRDAGPGGDACSKPSNMRKVTAGKFEGGKTLDDYFPDQVGAGIWNKNDTAGPFDTGTRAGSAVQLIGEYLSPCAQGGTAFTLGQTVHFVRAKANGKQMLEGGKPFEGTTIDDIKRSGRDQSKPPFRQEFNFAVSMADPISGIPYKTLTSYEFEVNLTTSLTGPGGSRSVDWGVTIEASGGKVSKNEVR